MMDASQRLLAPGTPKQMIISRQRKQLWQPSNTAEGYWPTLRDDNSTSVENQVRELVEAYGPSAKKY